MNYFIEQYVDRKGNLLQTKPLPIDKKPEKVNQFRKSQYKTVAFWIVKPKV